jgi:hypothetical protein
MGSVRSRRVTFDTNACDIIHDPDKRPEIMDPAGARALRQAIADAKVTAFVSEATLFVECLSFEDKLTYLSVAGTKNPRPAPDPRRTAVFSDLASLGVKLLHAPLIGAEIFIPGLDWADDVVHSATDRHSRFCAFARGYPLHEPIKVIGRQLLAQQPPVPAGRSIRSGPDSVHIEIPQDWAIAIKREWNARDDAGRKTLRKQISPLIGEWCDTLIVGSHLAYGNDIFCTADEGKSAGSGSLLFHGNRANLEQQGIHIMSPTKLLQEIS